MARLNEPAGETLECLKRRFIRQNKELVLSNSTQSLKIRTLEGEITRLALENARLFEENTQLRAQSRRKVDIVDIEANIELIKKKLDDHALELLESLTSITLHGKRTHVLAATSDSSTRAQVYNQWQNSRSPESRGIMGSLPTIIEGISLSQDQSSTKSDNDFLDIGIVAEATTLPHTPQGCLSQQSSTGGARLIQSDSSACTNEEREKALVKVRKRRSKVISDPHTNFAVGETNPAVIDVISSDARACRGRGRITPQSKNPRQQESANLKGLENEPSLAFNSGRLSAGSLSSAKAHHGKQERAQSGRKPLSIRPVNTDPSVSPRKRKHPSDESSAERPEQRAEGRFTVTNPKNGHHVEDCDSSRNTGSNVELHTDSRGFISCIEAVDEIKTEPLTPALLELTSPMTDPRSEPRWGSKDTPPPPNAGDRLGKLGDRDGQRERRVRTAVNYAEPNLITKMRRPTKDLVDAVERDDKRVAFRLRAKSDHDVGNGGSIPFSTPLNEGKHVGDPPIIHYSGILVKDQASGDNETKLRHFDHHRDILNLDRSIGHSSAMSPCKRHELDVPRNDVEPDLKKDFTIGHENKERGGRRVKNDDATIFDLIESPPLSNFESSRISSRGDLKRVKSRKSATAKIEYVEVLGKSEETLKSSFQRQAVGFSPSDQDMEQESSKLSKPAIRKVSLRRRSTML